VEGLQTFTTAILVAALVYTATNLVKFVRAKDLNGVLTIVLAWAVGTGCALWLANADVTESIAFIEGAPPIGDLNFGSLALLGIGFGGLASVIADIRSARDNNDSAAKPPLVP
jgi:hypothetical protein